MQTAHPGSADALMNIHVGMQGYIRLAQVGVPHSPNPPPTRTPPPAAEPRWACGGGSAPLWAPRR